MGHIALSRGADAIVVAPASADFIAKLAHGIADDLLSTLCLARECPLLVAPAMNRQMWGNAATQRNVAQLRADGVTILGPDTGDQACGEVGEGRMLEPEAIHRCVARACAQPQVLAGKRVLLTAGPTFEAIDPVRGITNSSSGKMGFALAQAAAEAGAQRDAGGGSDVAGRRPPACRASTSRAPRRWPTRSSRASTQRHLHWRRRGRRLHARARLRTQDQEERRVDDPVAEADHRHPGTVAARTKPPFCVGFAAESQDVERFAEDKRRRKNLPLIVANRAQDALGSDANEVVLLDDRGAHPLPRMDKLALARRLVAEIAQRLPK